MAFYKQLFFQFEYINFMLTHKWQFYKIEDICWVSLPSLLAKYYNARHLPLGYSPRYKIHNTLTVLAIFWAAWIFLNFKKPGFCWIASPMFFVSRIIIKVLGHEMKWNYQTFFSKTVTQNVQVNVLFTNRKYS